MLDYHVTYTLAQADAPPPVTPGSPTPGAPAPGTTEAPAPGTGPTGQQGDPGSPFTGIWMMVGLFLLMWVLIFLPQRKEKKRRAELLAAIKKGDKVQTIGGILGIVLDVKEDEVVVKVDEANNTKMRFVRSAVQTILTDGKPAETK